jgi:aspartyl/glutamyl-tRNA(Asn/Gln) amidotransferase C subunit
MPDTISKETFDHLVDLAALQLGEEEAAYLLQQLNNQLKAIHELEAIPLDDDTTITTHGVPYTPQIAPLPRPDLWRPFSRTEDILSQAPETEDGYIVVPEIPHTDLA